MSTHQILQLRVEKELHEFLSNKAEEEGLTLEEYTANVISKQVNIEEIIENIKADKNKYSLSRTPMDVYRPSSGMDIGCSTVQVDVY